MVGLSGVELFEELGGKGGIFSDKHGGFRRCRCWGVDRWVGVFRHSLSVVDAQGVMAKGSVGLAVFKGLGFLLGLLPL